MKAEQSRNSDQIEARIDSILEQIQAIISGLEDSLYSKIGKVEGDII